VGVRWRFPCTILFAGEVRYVATVAECRCLVGAEEIANGRWRGSLEIRPVGRLRCGTLGASTLVRSKSTRHWLEGPWPPYRKSSCCRGEAIGLSLYNIPQLGTKLQSQHRRPSNRTLTILDA
jgi:hypothetical protein